MRITNLFLFVVLSLVDSINLDHRTINLALETSLLLEPKDAETHLSVVNRIKTFLDKLTDLLEPQANMYRTYHHFNDDNNLLEVLKKFGHSVLHITKDGIKNISQAVNSYITDMGSKELSFRTVLDNPSIKNLIKNSIDHIFKTDEKELKSKIFHFLHSGNPVLHKMTRRLNRYYNTENINKFNEFLDKFNRLAHMNKDPSKIIIEWLDYSIFDQYNKLNFTARKTLLNDIKMLVNYLTDNVEFSTHYVDNNLRYGNISRNLKVNNVSKAPKILKVLDDHTKTEEIIENVIPIKDTKLTVNNIDFIVSTV